MANLTYRCGSAREFFYADGSHSPSQSMTCQWDKTWSPTSYLGTCDWVACLKPPTPPSFTNLRVNHWFGDPIPFGSEAMYVCERGYYFKDDYHRTHVNYTCQDGNNAGFEGLRGFFNAPEYEEEWPKCIRSPICPDPPLTPTEGVREVISLPITVDNYKQCSVSGDELNLRCNSFLNIHIANVTYGRTASKKKELCDGDKPDDSFAPTQDCYDADTDKLLLNIWRAECRGLFECVTEVPTLPLSPICDGKRREMIVEYFCGLLRPKNIVKPKSKSKSKMKVIIQIFGLRLTL